MTGSPEKSRNTFFVQRHGESEANALRMIVSHPHIYDSNDDFSLTELGEEQVRTSVREARAKGWLGEDTVIYASPFLRCKRTAEIAREELGAGPVIFDDRLRERWFGEFERANNENYQKVWDEDKRDPAHTTWSVESAERVQQRTLGFVQELENKYAGKTILLVSHGDSLQILFTGIQGTSPASHREVPHLNVAEIRKLE
jgi:broad specificity phosphatase PhoE